MKKWNFFDKCGKIEAGNKEKTACHLTKWEHLC